MFCNTGKQHEVAFVSGFRVSGYDLGLFKGKKGDIGVFYGSLLNCTNGCMY